MKHHESAAEMHAPQLGTNRSFGFVFTFVFLAMGVYKIASTFFASGQFQISVSAGTLLFAGLLTLAVAVIVPSVLHLPNLLWFKLGVKLHVFFSFAIMAFLFFGLFLAIGTVLKILGKTPIPKSESSKKQTYWTRRDKLTQVGEQNPDQWTNFNFQF